MTRRRDHRGRYPLLLDDAGIRATLLTINTDALALHFPNPDGMCPICRVQGCSVRLRAVRTVRAAGGEASMLPPHPPTRPQWHCERCDDAPWPCSPARVELGDRYGWERRGDLARDMRALMKQARDELPRVSESELRDRFVAWTQPWG